MEKQTLSIHIRTMCILKRALSILKGVLYILNRVLCTLKGTLLILKRVLSIYIFMYVYKYIYIYTIIHIYILYFAWMYICRCGYVLVYKICVCFAKETYKRDPQSLSLFLRHTYTLSPSLENTC